MQQPPTPNLARRSILTLALTGAIGALSACGGDSKKGAVSGTSSSGSAGQSAAAGPKIAPVAGFSSSPTWSSTQVKDLAGLIPVTTAGAAWHADHAWFLMSQGTNSNSEPQGARIVALDPASKQVAVSAVVDAKMVSGTRTQWVTITHPSPAIIFDAGDFQGGSVLVKLSGDTITTTPLPAPPNGGNPVWMGDVVVAPGTSDNGAGSVYDPATNTYTPLKAEHGGRVIGATVAGGKVAAVELTGGTEDEPKTRVYANGRNASSGIAGDGGQDRAIRTMAWTANGKLVLSVDGPTNGDVIYMPYDADLKPASSGAYPNASNPDQFSEDANAPQPQAISTDRAVAILGIGLLYDAAANRVTRGVWTSSLTMSWDLGNTAVTSGHLYANASPNPATDGFPTSGAYTSATGALNDKNQADKTAPALIVPNGDGLFLTEAAELLPKS